MKAEILPFLGGREVGGATVCTLNWEGQKSVKANSESVSFWSYHWKYFLCSFCFIYLQLNLFHQSTGEHSPTSWYSLPPLPPLPSIIMSQEKKHTSTGQHVEVKGHCLESKCACPFRTYVAGHTQFSFFTFRCHLCQTQYWDQTHAGVQKHTQSCKAKESYREYQSAGLALQHDWWFSRSARSRRCLQADLAPQSCTRGVTFLPTGRLTRAQPLLSFPFYCEKWWLKIPSICCRSSWISSQKGNAKGAISVWKCHVFHKDSGGSLMFSIPSNLLKVYLSEI